MGKRFGKSFSGNTQGTVKQDPPARTGYDDPNCIWAGKMVIYKKVGSLYKVIGQHRNGGRERISVAKIMGNAIRNDRTFEVDPSQIAMLFVQLGDNVTINDGGDIHVGSVTAISNDSVKRGGNTTYEINVSITTTKSKLLIFEYKKLSSIIEVEEG